MSSETLNNNLIKHKSANKVNVEVLKKRIIMKKKKEIFQTRIVYLSIIVSIGLIGYFIG